jgi:hypothetical protein
LIDDGLGGGEGGGGDSGRAAAAAVSRWGGGYSPLDSVCIVVCHCHRSSSRLYAVWLVVVVVGCGGVGYSDGQVGDVLIVCCLLVFVVVVVGC